MNRTSVLGLDTSTLWLNLALVDLSGSILEETREHVATHTTRLVPGLEGLMSRAHLGSESLAAVGVVAGPGSFTGLRVGLAAAEGLAQALAIPAYGLDTLSALARSARDDGCGVAVLDARRGQVYLRRFVRRGEDLEALDEPRAADPAGALADTGELRWAVGDGVPLLSPWPEGCALYPGIPNLAVFAARAACDALGRGLASHDLSPVYVRAPDVREPAAKRVAGPL